MNYSAPRKWWLVGLLTALICSHLEGFDEETSESEFPYTLIVAKETADVLSGPGRNHYATDRLPKGTRVEIYRHDPGGFYAIRPPKGSFSLVLASKVKATTHPDVVEVSSPSAKAWVGTRLQGKFKPMWQLKLKAGELLNAVKRVEIPGSLSGQSESWYQVEPPKGEFRWIHQDDLGPLAPASVSTAEIAGQQIDAATNEVELMKQLGNARTQQQIASTERNGWKVLDGAGYPASNISANEAFFDRMPNTVDSFAENIESIDLALSQMILSPKSMWKLDRLQALVDQLRKEARTGSDLAKANVLAQKIIDFQKLKLNSNEEIAASSSSASTQSSANTQRAALLQAASSVRYDGKGVLRRMYTNGGNGPAIYALEDEQGKIVKTITPSTGVNLERFLDKPVGLFGKSGFNQRLNRPHLTAQRVVDLNKIR